MDDGEVGTKKTQAGAKMNEDSTRPGAPEVLTFSLNLPVENPPDSKSGGIEDYCTYRTYGFAADTVGNSLAEPVGVVGEEKILPVEKVERGFEIEGSVLPAVVRDVAERSSRERERSASRGESGCIRNQRAGSCADIGLVDLGRRDDRRGDGYWVGSRWRWMRRR